MGLLPELENQYPEGSDLTIMNSYYQYPSYDDGKKVSDDYMFLTYKDNNTGKKGYKIIPRPNYTYYKIKENEKIPNYNMLFIPREKVEAHTVEYGNLLKDIAEQTGNMDYYKMNLANRNKQANNELHTLPEIFFSDVNIEDHYRFKFANTYSNDIRKLNKGFFDIEVDGKWAKGDFVELGECAVNCVSFYDDGTDTVYVFVLRDERNPQIFDLEMEIKSGKFGWQEMHDFIIKSVGGEKQAKKYGLMETKFSVNFYDYEIELLRDLFGTMHRCSPDFIEGWNSSAFDLAYIIERIKVLGYDPADIMCDQSWPIKIVKNYVDQKNINELAERGDYTFISGLPVFIDQMIQYASRRKSKIGSFKSFKLDDIGEKEAKVKKLDYHHITDKVTELPWLDFKTFFLYNIMDVIVQKCIETKTQDLEYIFSKCVVNNTAYKKGHRQTIYLINRMAADWYKMGYIIGTNNNRNNPKPPKYLGAIVGDPLKTNSYSKMNIDGRTIWVCEHLTDYDYKSLYPSIMSEFNIAPNTQIGRIEIPVKVYENENLYNIEADKYSRGGEFIENLVTDNMIEYCHRWFHLANFEEILEDIDEFYNNLNLGRFSNLEAVFNSPIVPTSSGIQKPVQFDQPLVTPPVIFYNNRDPKYNYNDLYFKKEKINE